MKKTFFLCFIILSQLSFSQIFDTETILQSGPNENRINLVILSDGYQSSELDQFVIDANNFTEAFFDETPYKEYKNYFNVHIIKVPSNESGASHPGTATDVTEPGNHPVLAVDNYFGSTFDYYSIHRLLVATNTTAIYNVLANNFPMYDQVLMLTNSPFYGGSGGAIATTSLETTANEIAIHEIGHSFTDLADEYYAGDFYATEAINMTQDTNPTTVRWKNWMNQNGIGIYQHCCGGSSASWYRPHQSCKMRYLGVPFCSVCIEGTIERIHTLISPIESYSPEDTGTIDLTTPMTFSVDAILPVPNTLSIEWTLNGTALDNSNYSVLISESDLMPGNNQLQVTIEDTTTLLNVDGHDVLHLDTILWNIDSSSLSIDDISTENLKIELFPNPTQDILFIDIIKEVNKDYDIIISDVSGKQLISKSINYLDLRPQVELKSLPSGVYFIKFKFENGLNISKKIIKK